jgi:hypothetical protein
MGRTVVCGTERFSLGIWVELWCVGGTERFSLGIWVELWCVVQRGLV